MDDKVYLDEKTTALFHYNTMVMGYTLYSATKNIKIVTEYLNKVYGEFAPSEEAKNTIVSHMANMIDHGYNLMPDFHPDPYTFSTEFIRFIYPEMSQEEREELGKESYEFFKGSVERLKSIMGGNDDIDTIQNAMFDLDPKRTLH